MAGRPATNDKVNEAVEAVANGIGPREAWRLAGRPNGESAIQNIGRRGRELKRKRAAADAVPEPEYEPAEPVPRPKKERKVYANARQTEQLQARAQAVKDERKALHKRASHVLSLTCYATDATADEEMWVLLGPKETAPLMLTTTVAPAAAPAAASASSRARGKQRKAPAATPMTAVAHGVDDAAIAAMSPAEAQALIMRLNARMGGNSSAADAALP